MSYSYFENGIRDVNPKKNIDFPQLIKIIKNNPKRSLIEQIRMLRFDGDDYYKTLKDTLPNITPNCIVTKRGLKGNKIDINLKVFSQYIYFDIDEPRVDYKNYIIKKYGHLISMVCISPSCGGVSILFKISNEITKNNFDKIWRYIRFNILKDENVDTKCKDIGRAMYISFDENVYVNYENELSIDEEELYLNIITDISKNSASHPISISLSSNRLNGAYFKVIPFDEVLKKINLKTPVDIKNKIVDIIPVEFNEIRIIRKFNDDEKHKKYTSLIHLLVHLNPDIEPDYLFSFMNYLNNTMSNHRMGFRELVRLFKFVYNSIKNNPDYQYKNKRTRIKSIHFDKEAELTGKEKNKISNQLNGKLRKNKSIELIQKTKEYLIQNGIKVTKKSIALHSGLGINTIGRNFNEETTDMDELIQIFNDSIPRKN